MRPGAGAMPVRRLLMRVAAVARHSGVATARARADGSLGPDDGAGAGGCQTQTSHAPLGLYGLALAALALVWRRRRA